MSAQTETYKPLVDQAPETNVFRGRLFGQAVSFEYSETWVATALVAMRVVMGWILFQGGITKVLNPGWTAAGYLQNAIPEGNPFGAMFANMAGSPMIDFLVMWGLTLTGLGLIIGALVRWNAFWGAFMMFMFYLAALQGGVAEGLPLEHGWVFDDHLVYVALLFGLGAFGAGRILGVDAVLEKTEVVRNNPWLKLFLG
ncbi:MAG: DoxX family membrane protein [Candidatus Promineifilaceae bacterium]|nr:DoxX family membrane protein [Candidatus Promineifilaceae bacterium]